MTAKGRWRCCIPEDAVFEAILARPEGTMLSPKAL
jgi:hypothetical protein